MAIRIKTLDNISNTKTQMGSIYRDLYLDITYSKLVSTNINFPNSIRGGDIKISEDVAAIENSLHNLFSTRPGQRILFPEYGTNLDYYLFQPISQQAGESIGNTILNKISIYEPRVKIKAINVVAQPDNNQYVISIYMDIIVLNLVNVQSTFVFNVNTQTFTIIQSQ